MNTSRSISNSNHLNRCVKHLNNFCLLLLSSVLPEQSRSDVQAMIQQMNVLSLRSVRLRNYSRTLSQLLALIILPAREVIRKVKVYIQTRKVNARVIVGVFLVGCLAPLSDIFYTWGWLERFYWFNHDSKVEGWYYDNLFYLFLCLGPYLDKLFTAAGLYYILVPVDTKRSWFATIPMGLALGRIIWLLQVDNHLEFHTATPWLYIFNGLLVSSCLWFLTDYMAWRKYHRADSYERRMDTITTAHKYKLLPAEKIADDFVTTWQEMKAKNY